MTRSPTLVCTNDRDRRARARRAPLNGIDYVEVSDDQKHLTVFFLGLAPDPELTRRQVVITGGRRIREIGVTEVTTVRSGTSDLDDCLKVTVDRAGDSSTYSLCIVDPEGRSTSAQPPRDFDPRYASASFSFKAGCPSDLDCLVPAVCDEASHPTPAMDYLAKDYGSFRQLMLDRLSLIMPDWRERHVPDIGITLVELLAYVGDQLSYYQDAVATEAYLRTARRRISVRRHLRLVDYRLHEGCNARTWVTVSVSQPHLAVDSADIYFTTAVPDVNGPVASHETLLRQPATSYLVFEPAGKRQRYDWYEPQNRIRFYTWGETECCLPRGATSATLIDPGEWPAPTVESPPYTQKGGEDAATSAHGPREGPNDSFYRLALAPCDVLIFEEVLGPLTGVAADADPTHRHAVRLTHVERLFDPLTRQLLVEIAWCREDALPFPLCISSVTLPPECEPLANVSVARGNVILVDHGRTEAEDLGQVPVCETLTECAEPCRAAEVRKVPGRFRPSLRHPEVTHRESPAECNLTDRRCDAGCKEAAATATPVQDPRVAMPVVHLDSSLVTPDGSRSDVRRWEPRHDLLGSGPDDLHFVVETDDDRRAYLRFGDGVCGRHPGAGEAFCAVYRVGNGPVGNVGADSITTIVFRNNRPDGVDLTARNPLPASGGTAPEDVARARLRGPHLIRRRLERAIIPRDYAAIVERDFSAHVQRAAAVFRWDGAGTQVLVAVDARGSAETPAGLLRCIAEHLERYRRIGHALQVVGARHVPLLLALTICVKPSYVRGHVKAAVLARFGTGVLAQGRKGWFHPDNLSFGEGVFVSKIVAAAQEIEGVESVVVEQLERLFEGPNGERAAGVLPLEPMEVARLDNSADFPEHGQLLLTLAGGR